MWSIRTSLTGDGAALGFLAVLELDRVKQVDVKQEKLFGEIEVKYREGGDAVLLAEDEEYD